MRKNVESLDQKRTPFVVNIMHVSGKEVYLFRRCNTFLEATENYTLQNQELFVYHVTESLRVPESQSPRVPESLSPRLPRLGFFAICLVSFVFDDRCPEVFNQ